MDRSQKTNRQEITAYLDRLEPLEDGSATAVFLVEVDDDEFSQFTLPAEFLPEDADEGEYLTVTISRDETQSARFRVKALAKNSATLSADDAEEFTLPADFLPAVDEGDYLTIKISRDTDEAQELPNNLEE